MPKNATLSQKKCSVAWFRAAAAGPPAPTSSEKMPDAGEREIEPVGAGRECRSTGTTSAVCGALHRSTT